LALEQNPNGFRHLYGTTNLDALNAKPVEWDEVESEPTKEEKTEEKQENGEENDEEENPEEQAAVDQFLADIEYSDEEGEDPLSKQDPDFIPTPLMQQFGVFFFFF
jgi:hypothetical protein